VAIVKSTATANRRLLQPALLILLELASTSSMTGCASFRWMMASRNRDLLSGAPQLRNVNNPQMEEIVAHINRNAEGIRSWRANSVKIMANQWPLSGTLAVEKGNHVRLVVSSPVGKEFDLGSNDERFWVWSRRMDPPFVTCRHENMEAARQQLGLPFEPRWLMQALGVEPLSTANLKMEIDPSKRQARLIEEFMSTHGLPLRRAVLVDLKTGTVVEHCLYNYDGVRVALARLSGHEFFNTEGVVLPHRVLLDWPQNQMSMSMELGRIQLNPQSIPSEIWDMPDSAGYPIVQLDAGAAPHRIAVRPESAARVNPRESDGAPEDEQEESEETDDAPPERPFERPRDYSGRAWLLDEPVQPERKLDSDDDWAK
jgi:hypothetical protein